jgi:CRISPR type III-B/RAMP module RAMP protein Cmr1
MSTELRASLRIITPLFTGGADDAPATDGYIRAESINGLLRFWYRALHPTEAATNEFRIFGSGGEASSQSLFRLAVEECPPLHEPEASSAGRPHLRIRATV